MKREIVLALLAGAIGSCAAYDYGRRYYLGPASDHFDGRLFFNPAGAIGKGALDVIEWRLKGERAEWPEWAASPFADKPPRRVDGKNLRVSMVGHASFLIQAGGHNILLDPVPGNQRQTSFFTPTRERAPTRVPFGRVFRQPEMRHAKRRPVVFWKEQDECGHVLSHGHVESAIALPPN